MGRTTAPLSRKKARRAGGGNSEDSGRGGNCLLASAAALDLKFPAVILRVAGIYGPERGHWFRQFLNDEARIEGDGSRWLNMIHRDDVAGCIIAALKNGRAGEIYNAVDDEPVRQIDFFRWLAERSASLCRRRFPRMLKLSANAARPTSASQTKS